MFWKINFRQPSAIDGLLDKEECTLNEILDEDDVLQEVKSQNKKLVEFLLRPENLEQLVNYVCIKADPDMEDKYKFKYPHLACEILTADVFSIIEALSTGDKYLPMLWGFLFKEPPLNPLIGSFISKTLSMLLNQRASIFLDYIQKTERFVDSFLQHLGTSAMMDLLLQMITAPDGDQHRTNLALWLTEEGIITKLIDFIKPSANVDQCINSSQALCDMIRISRETSQMSGPSPLLTSLESEETIKRLLDNMFCEDQPPDWVIVNGTSVLLTALEKSNSTYSPTFGRPYMTQPSVEETQSDQDVERIITSIVPRMKDFHKLLNRRPQGEPMITTVGLLDPPLGNMRLQVVRLFSSLLHTQDTRVQREIILNSTCSVMMDLFFQYPWNNFLHSQVELCITSAFASTTPITLELDDGTGQANESNTLRQHLLTECKLVQRLLEGAELNESLVLGGKGSRQGFMGHLIRIANQIAGNTRALGLEMLDRTREELITNAEEGQLQSELDEDTFQRWSEFLTGPVAEMNKKNDTNLGGSRPLTSSIDDSDEEFDQLNMGPDNELEKAFQQYQDSRFSSAFMDDFGLDDDLDPAPIPYASTYTTLTSISCAVSGDENHTQFMAGFEAACAERIHPFDDSESDEEETSPWVDKEISFTPVDDQRTPTSTSDEEEEGENKGERRRREYPTGSSDDEEEGDSLSERRERMIIVEERQTNTANEIGVISWRSEFSTDEDLSGVTTKAPMDWTQEPQTNTQRQEENWADFTSVTFGKDEIKEDNPRVVSVTYVSVRELEATSNQSDDTAFNSYARLSSNESTESADSEEGIIVDPNLLSMTQHSLSDSSEDEDMNISSDEEKSGSYSFSEGDSANPLLNTSSEFNTPTKSCETSLNNDEDIMVDGETEEELSDNYRFLHNQRLLSDSQSTTPTENSHETRPDDDNTKGVVSDKVELSKQTVNT